MKLPKLNLFLYFIFLICWSELRSQCNLSVSGIYYYCDPVYSMDSFYVGFCSKSAPGTFEIIDRVTNRKNRGIKSPNNGTNATVLNSSVVFTATDTVYYIQFGPIKNLDSFNIRMRKVTDTTCFVDINKGRYTCKGKRSPGGCDTTDVPFYDIDFDGISLPSMVILKRARIQTCCQTNNNARCFELRVKLGSNSSGIELNTSGSGNEGGELYYAKEANFKCDSVKQNTNGLTLCLSDPTTYYIFSCKAGANQTALEIINIPSPIAEGNIITEPCNTFIKVSNIDSTTLVWSSPDDPGLLNLNCGSGPGVNIHCTKPDFLYDSVTYGVVTNCDGVKFRYIATAKASNLCDSLLGMDTAVVVVYPDYTLNIDQKCDSLHPDSVYLSAWIGGNGKLCNYNFWWSNGDTSKEIKVLLEAGRTYCVLASRDSLSGICEKSDCHTLLGSILLDCSAVRDSFFTCPDLIPPSDTTLIKLEGCGADSYCVNVLESTNGHKGCPGDTLKFTRFYIVDWDCNFSTIDDQDTCKQVFTIVDTIKPIISCPANVTINCDASTAPSNTGSATATDNCTNVVTNITFNDVKTGGSCNDNYSIARTWTATDSCGNAKTCLQNITVQDTTKPTISCPSNVTINCDASTAPSNTGSATATDNCTNVVTNITFNDVKTGGSCNDNYSIARTWTATDSCGNARTCLQTITVQDTTKPTISCPADVTVNCASNSIPGVTGVATAVDNCTNVVTDIVFRDAKVDGNCVDNFTISRTWVAKDSCGNFQSCLQLIQVQDTTKPTLNCPSNLTMDCDKSSQPMETGFATATDNCINFQLETTYSDQIIPGNCAGNYTINRSWSAIDRCLNKNSCLQIILIQDTTKPVILCPSDITLECNLSRLPDDTGKATASDNCTSLVTDISYKDSIAAGSCEYNFVIYRKWYAVDSCGNEDSCIQKLFIQDTSKPQIIPPSDVTITCAEDYKDLMITGNYVSASDRCGKVTVDFKDKIELTGCNNSGKIFRNWTATDACGNQTTAEQIITVLCPKFDLALKKTIQNSGPISYGDTVIFKITVVNQGCDLAKDIVITDYMSPGYIFLPALNPDWVINGDLMQTGISGPILPEDSSHVFIKFKITSLKNTGAFSWLNIAEISDAKDKDGNSINDVDSKYDTIPGNDMGGIPFSNFDDYLDGNGLDDIDASDIELPIIQDIALKKTLLKSSPFVFGNYIKYKLTVFNQGNIPLNEIEIKDFIPNGFAFETLKNPNWNIINDSTVYIILDNTLFPGDSLCDSITLKIIQPPLVHLKSWINYAEVQSAKGFGGLLIVDSDSDLGSNSVLERSIVPGSVEDNNIFVDFKQFNEDQDDHDVEGLGIAPKIGDFVWSDDNDNGIQDPMEAGVPNLVVCLFNGQGTLIKKDTSDLVGFYEFDNLAPDTYMILAQLGNLSNSYYFAKKDIGGDDKKDSDVGISGLSSTFVLDNFSCKDSIDIGLVPYAQLVGFVWNDANGNGIQDIGEDGIKGVTVILYDGITKLSLKTTLTDAFGKYAFTKLKAGSYFIKIIPPVNSKITLPNVGSDLKDNDIDNTNGQATSATVVLLSGTVIAKLDAGISYCASISGVVWNDINYNHILNIGEKGINGLSVKLYNAVTNQLVASVLSNTKPGTPSDDGYYIFNCLLPGSYYVKFEKPYNYYFGLPYKSPNPLYDSDVTKAFGIGTTDSIVITSGKAVTGINAALSRNPGAGGLTKLNDNSFTNDYLDPENKIDEKKIKSEDQKEILELEVFPVPATNELFIKVDHIKNIPFTFRIYNINGKEVYLKKVLSESECNDLKRFDLTRFASGNYKIFIQAGKQRYIKDFIIIH